MLLTLVREWSFRRVLAHVQPPVADTGAFDHRQVPVLERGYTDCVAQGTRLVLG
jgi:hypothetical protein